VAAGPHERTLAAVGAAMQLMHLPPPRASAPRAAQYPPGWWQSPVHAGRRLGQGRPRKLAMQHL
jgi:hypothetical protein